ILLFQFYHGDYQLKILVTGGAGFIGSNLIDTLLGQNMEIVAVDNFDAFYDKNIKERNIKQAMDYQNFHLYRTDILDRESLENIFRKHNPETIVHLAAKAGVRPSIDDPVGYMQTNIEGTTNLLELSKIHKIGKFIFASSSSVYGNNKKVPFSEKDPVDFPISPYAASKKAGELICYNYHHLYNMNIFALRFFTVYGPRQRPEMAIHKFTRLIDEEKPVPVYGEGMPRRDFTYITDIIEGIKKAILNVNGYEIINLGESQTISVSDLITEIENAVGKKAKREILPMQPGDVIETFADVTKAKNLLGYKPSTSIKKGISGFTEWYFSQNKK
ncbi:MAG: GDP-mannose 4,6-dehydratase, partial [Calditrichaceae bacterium]